MKDEMQAELDDVMMNYARSLGKGDHGDVDGFEEHCHVLCREAILPAMEKFAHKLNAHGHAVRIYGREMSVEANGNSRNAEVMMYVTPQGAQSGIKPSGGEFIIRFSFDPATHKMLAQLSEGADRACSYSRPFDLHPIEGVTPELVEQELLEMVRYGFECVRREIGAKPLQEAVI